MDVYDLIHEAIYHSNSLLYSAQNMVKFAKAAYKEKNRATLVRLFYQRLYEYSL